MCFDHKYVQNKTNEFLTALDQWDCVRILYAGVLALTNTNYAGRNFQSFMGYDPIERVDSFMDILKGQWKLYNHFYSWFQNPHLFMVKSCKLTLLQFLTQEEVKTFRK